MNRNVRELKEKNEKTSKMKTKRPFSIKKYMKTPKGYALLLLLLLAVLSFTDIRNSHGFINLVAAMLSATIVDFLAAIIQKRKPSFSDGGLITGLIVGMILSTNSHWPIIVITSGVAAASKHLLKMKRKPMFNPAAVGLFIATIFFSSGQSWWGALTMSKPWTLIFLLVIGFLITKRVNKFPQVFVFLGLYFLAFLLMGIYHVGSPGDPLRSPFVNSALFLAFFMLTDPPTSPGSYKDQAIFGGIAAIVSVLYYVDFGGLAYLFVGLLSANAWKAWWSWRKKPQARSKVPSSRIERRKRLTT